MKDNFSKQADIYAQYRPEYPAELFEFIISQVKNTDSAWDCATGNGQAAKELAKYFRHVTATDISQKQLDNAHQVHNIEYLISAAEETSFADNSFDLVTVAQALHWFNFDKFYPEIKRVLKNDGIFATWMYELNSVEPQIDAVMRHLYEPILGEYWDKERKHIENEYSTIPFPLENIQTARFYYEIDWTVEHYLGYLRTWSSTQKYIKANQQDPVSIVEADLRNLWGESKRIVTFPIFLKLGSVSK